MPRTGRPKTVEKLTFICDVCGKLHQRYPSNLKEKTETSHHFCSMKCAATMRKEYLRPKKLGCDHFNWKGGRVKQGSSENSPIKVLKRDHPHRDRHNYVYEHRLVMEQHIGRYLTKKEIVHHKNGIKYDNRIENLELIEGGFKQHSTLHNKNRIKGSDGRFVSFDHSLSVSITDHSL